MDYFGFTETERFVKRAAKLLGADFQQEPSLTDIRAVRDDPDLKGEFYLGEFVVSQENVYLIEPSGQTSVIGKMNEIFAR